jgi:hypothetical protein
MVLGARLPLLSCFTGCSLSLMKSLLQETDFPSNDCSSLTR